MGTIDLGKGAHSMNPVLVKCADSDVIIFESAEAASRFMEAPDVRDGGYLLVLDAAALELEPVFEVEGRFLKRERVVLVQKSPPRAHPEELRSMLIRVLEIHGDAIGEFAPGPSTT
ncbi:MAG TPA: hypothetical protein VGK67_06780 [Myxococcales bacterium]